MHMSISGDRLRVALCARTLSVDCCLSKLCQRRRTIRLFSSIKPNRSTAAHEPHPSKEQLWRHFVVASVPMIGFGFMDQTVMIQAGNAIDCTIGVTFGISTLAAAAFGQICANAAGVVFGGTVESVLKKAGLPTPGFTSAQYRLPIVMRAGILGSLLGVVLGCSLGLFNLLLIDTDLPSTLKLNAMSDDQEFSFEVEASNSKRPDATTLTVRGPDVDGILASMTSALSASDCSLVTVNAGPRDKSIDVIEDVFVVVERETKQQIDDEKLDELAHSLLAATKDPVSVHSLKKQVKELQEANQSLKRRATKLQKTLEDRQISVVPSSPTAD